MAYKKIETAAFVPAPGTGPFLQAYNTLRFPPQWREAILRFEREGKNNPDRIQNVPIRSLNAAIRALAPDLVSVSTRAAERWEAPWLYTTSEYPTSVLQSLILSWLRYRQPSPDAFRALTDTHRALDLPALAWDLECVDLLRQDRTAGGTAKPDDYVYRLLPDVLAAKIEAQPPYEYFDREVRFYRVGADYLGGAELISWPPTPHQPKGKDDEDYGHPWLYSGVIRVSVQTEPFSPVPRVHLSTGIRRWVHGRVSPASGNSASTYLRTEGQWISGGTTTSRFAVAPLRARWGRGKKKDEVTATWALGGPADILSRLSIGQDFPKPEDLARDAEGWIRGRGGVEAAVAYHTPMFGSHGAGAGMMPSERRRLVQWAGKALLPHFEPLGGLRRSRHSVMEALPARTFAEPMSVPREPKGEQKGEKATPEQVEKYEAERAVAESANAVIDSDNARLRREHLARVVGASRVLSCHLLYQTDAVRDAIVAAAESSLDLREHRALFPEDTTGWRGGTLVWRAPDLELRMHVREAHTLVTELGGQEAPKRGRETREAIAGRRGEVTAFLQDEDASQLALVEIEPRKKFAKRTRDPKFAVRLGCADAGRVSQFINPVAEVEGGRRGKKKDLVADLAYRAEAAWADGLRQLGLSFVPEHSIKGDAIPAKLNQVAFWMVRRNVSAQFSARQFTPVAVLIRPDQDCIMGRTAGMRQWVPYPELLRRLAGQERGDDLKSKAQRRAETARFVRQVLYTLRGEHTVVLTHAQNARQSWDWLQDGRLEPDRIQLGDGPVQSLALHGRNLRIIRVRDGERDETAQWWAPREDDEDEAGLSKGLWVPPGPEGDRRVFYATGAKGASHQFSRVEDTKLTWHATDKVPDGEINGGANAWNPTLLEITVAGCAAGDRPVDWAMWVQQQRFPDHYRDEGLKLPLALHLAAKATEYALPHEYAEARLLEDVPEDGTAVSDDGIDGTEETGGILALADDEEEAGGDY
jgi:hypothetical protein